MCFSLKQLLSFFPFFSFNTDHLEMKSVILLSTLFANWARCFNVFEKVRLIENLQNNLELRQCQQMKPGQLMFLLLAVAPYEPDTCRRLKKENMKERKKGIQTVDKTQLIKAHV